MQLTAGPLFSPPFELLIKRLVRQNRIANPHHRRSPHVYISACYLIYLPMYDFYPSYPRVKCQQRPTFLLHQIDLLLSPFERSLNPFIHPSPTFGFDEKSQWMCDSLSRHHVDLHRLGHLADSFNYVDMGSAIFVSSTASVSFCSRLFWIQVGTWTWRMSTFEVLRVPHRIIGDGLDNVECVFTDHSAVPPPQCQAPPMSPSTPHKPSHFQTPTPLLIMANTTSKLVGSHIAILSNMSCDLLAMRLCANKQMPWYQGENDSLSMQTLKKTSEWQAYQCMSWKISVSTLEHIVPHTTSQKLK